MKRSFRVRSKKVDVELEGVIIVVQDVVFRLAVLLGVGYAVTHLFDVTPLPKLIELAIAYWLANKFFKAFERRLELADEIIKMRTSL